MDPLLGLNDPTSKGAAEISFCYDKLREAELMTRFWTFAISPVALQPIDTTTMLMTPGLWSQLTTYFNGSIIADQNGGLWISQIPNNLGNDPLLTTAWKPYFGPLSVSRYATGNSYFAGEVVYTYSGNGASLVYLSLIGSNSDNPGVATAYSAIVTYYKNQVVTFASVAYMSLINLNLANEPDLAPALFNIATTYATGNKVGGSDGVIYQSVGNGNVGNDPTLDAGVHWTNTGVLNPWTTVFVGGTGSVNWLLIGGTGFPNGVGLTTLQPTYPLGAGPSSQAISKNAYLLPAGYLRVAPQNPKPGMNPLGGPSGVSFDDWQFERGYLVTAQTGTITLRFVGDITDVSLFHGMFCEALALRIALEVCETVTQSAAKVQTIAASYKKFEGDAKAIDGIEDGFIDAPDDDYLTVRN
jgi:hypothetical protein